MDQSEVQTGKHTVTLLNFVFIKWVIFNWLKLAIFSFPPFRIFRRQETPKRTYRKGCGWAKAFYNHWKN